MYENFGYDSSWELYKMHQLDIDEEVQYWTKKHRIHLEYFFKGKKTFHVPDFLIVYKNDDIVLEEIKGYDNKEKLLEKQKIAKEYCDRMGFIYKSTTYDKKMIRKFFKEKETKAL